MNKKQFRKTLYQQSDNGIQTQILCTYHLTTDHIGINDGFYKQSYKHKPPNKECATWLGCDIAEKVLIKVFKNVEVMLRSNKGYDIICGQGFLIDIKSATLNIRGKWMFNIKMNKKPDYFLCIAFDNRNDLNPLHLWLIPGKVINHLTGVGIQSSTVKKWSRYELTEKNKDVISCCNILKNRDL